MNTKQLDKVLKNHARHCAMHQFSLQDDRYCSCGRDEALDELTLLKEAADFVVKAVHWMNNLGNLETNSAAYYEMDELAKKIQGFK